MDVDDMAVKGKRTLPVAKGKLVWILVLIIFALSLAIAVASLRYRVTVFKNTVFLLERWTGTVTLIHEDGSFIRIRRGKPERGQGIKKLGIRIQGLRQLVHRESVVTKKNTGGSGIKGAAVKTVAIKGKKPSGKKLAGADAKLASSSSGAPAASKTSGSGASSGASSGIGTCCQKSLRGTGAQVFPVVRWANDRIRYRITVHPYTEQLKKMRTSPETSFWIDFIDKKGATLKSLKVAPSDMKLLKDEKEAVIGLELRGREKLGQSEFLSIVDWKIRTKG